MLASEPAKLDTEEQEDEDEEIALPPIATYNEAVEFIIAADENRAEKLMADLKLRPDLAEEVDEEGLALLHVAAAEGKLSFVRAVLSCPSCKPGIRNSRGENAAHVAQCKSHSDCVEAIYAAIEGVRATEAWYF